MDTLKFLTDLSMYLEDRAPLPQQADYMQRVGKVIHDGENGVVEMDAGAGKTIAYLITIMFLAVETGKPVIIATSTISNRNQIVEDYDKIQRYAATIDHPIAQLPLVNYRSLHDYVSIDRVEHLLERLRTINAPNLIISELEAVYESASAVNAPLLDDILPIPIMRPMVIEGVESAEVFVGREDISISLTEGHSEEIDKDRCKERINGVWEYNSEIIKDFADRPCVIVTTQAMLAKHRTFRDFIKNGTAGGVIIDECDRMLGLDFLQNVDFSISELGLIIELFQNQGLDVSQAKSSLHRLEEAIQEVKSLFSSRKPVMLRKEIMPDAVCESVFSMVQETFDKLNTLKGSYSTHDVDYGDLDSEVRFRRFDMRMDEILGSMELFHSEFCAQYPTETFRRQTDADVRVFLQWEDDEPSLHIVTISPGRIMKWVFASEVPVVLTSAFVASSHQQFSRDIGMSGGIHAMSGEVRMRQFGEMHFTYVTDMPNAIEVRRVNPEYIKAVAHEIIEYYKAGSRMLVLAPSYNDLRMLADLLDDLPILVQQRGAGIKGLTERLIKEPGILLTVLWEGYNIVANGKRDDGRRGLLDTIVISRLPFPHPNEMVRTGLKSIYGDRAEWWLFPRHRNEVIRSVYQGIGRGVRGPKDKCEVLIMDGRMAPPQALLRQNPLIQTKPKHKELVKVIPQRFVNSERNFTWKKSGYKQ